MQLTRHVIGNLKTKAEEALKKEIEGVHGVAITYDLWMSRKTDDLLAICIHYITADWVWHTKHLGLLPSCGRTKGVHLGKNMHDLLKSYGLLGKLFAATYDGGGNMNTAKNELERLSAAALTFITPVKTRFTSTWRMLARMLLMKDVVHQLFSEDRPISKRDRCPTPTDWHVAKAVVDELDFPCKHPEPSPARQEEQQDEEPTQFESELDEMRKDMRKHIAQHIQPMLRPLTEFVPEKAHEIMAMQLDPRYCKGNLFKLMLGKQEEARELMKEYDDKSLLPALVHLSRHMQT
eukprot:jgi/Tetstr1/443789/TSEL_031777.t1